MKKITTGRDVLGEFAPKFAQLNDDVLFGEVWSRQEQLSARDRSLITVTALLSQGLTGSSFQNHLKMAKENGITRSEIAEILTHAAFYAGWPKAWAAFRLAKEIWVEKGSNFMEYAVLNNGVKMPMAGIGTFLLSPDEAEASVINALKNGYRLIDTANAYMNEKAVGRAMKKSGVPREEIFLETKLWPSFYEQPDAVEKTLERLDTDYIDLLLIHQPAGNYIAGYRQMEAAYKAGKVRAIGLSNFNQAQIEEILSICEVKPTVLQTEVHPYSQEKELKAFLKEKEMVAQAWYPLGHGDSALLAEPLFAELGEKYGKSPAQIILRWHIQDGNIVIPGSKNPDHIKANFELFDFALTDEEMAKIAALNKNVRYYTSTPELLKKYAEMVPPVDTQK